MNLKDLNKNFLVISTKSTLNKNDAINESIDNIIRSLPQTHPFNRSFGYFNTVLFSDLNEKTASKLLSDIQDLISVYLPSIEMDMTRSKLVPNYEGQYYSIYLYYFNTEDNTEGNYGADILTNEE